MPSKDWYLHIQGETMGPLNTETVCTMLRQNRLQFTDYIWEEDLTKWVRISELDAFAAMLPPYPQTPIPSRKQKTEHKAHVIEPPKPQPQSKTKAEPVREPHKEVRSWPKSRKSIRIPIEASVTIEGYGKFDTVNLSEGGIFVHSAKKIPIGTELKLKLESPSFEKILEMTGVVIREGISDTHDGFAIEFTRVNPAHKRLVREYILSKGA